MALKEFDLSGKVALVTGGGRGLGEHIALALAEAGADVALAGRNLPNLRRVANRVQEIGREALAVKADVRREREVSRMVERVRRRFGRIDILVNNAGIIHRGPSLEVPLKTWQNVLDTNLTGPFLCMRACQPIMARQGKGAIINLSSVAGLFGRANLASYCATKAAIANLTRALAIEWAPYGIRVNAIAPGQFDTDMGAPLLNDKKALRAFLQTVPLRRVANPKEIGALAVLLAVDAGNYMTGTITVIDGGVTAS